MSVALAAQLVTAPLVAGHVGHRSAWSSVVANLAVAAVIPPITVIGTGGGRAVARCGLPRRELLIRFTGPELWWLLQRGAVGGGGARRASVPVPSGLAGVRDRRGRRHRRGGAVAMAVGTRRVALRCAWCVACWRGHVSGCRCGVTPS